MVEPPRITSLDKLPAYVASRVRKVMDAMLARGFHPKIVESLRTKERQRWLWGQGRSKAICLLRCGSTKYSHPGAIVTKTLNSMHLKGKAVDICDAKTGYKDMAFFRALGEEAKRVGLHQLAEIRDWAHLEFRG